MASMATVETMNSFSQLMDARKESTQTGKIAEAIVRVKNKVQNKDLNV